MPGRNGSEYFAVVTSSNMGGYALKMTMSSSDIELVSDIGGKLPDGELIAYVSNAVGDNNNLLGANYPKQLVYLDFDGGIATKYEELFGVSSVNVDAFDLGEIEKALDGYEDTIINGSSDVWGIVDNILDIFENTTQWAPSWTTHPAGILTVVRIEDAADWISYQSSPDGLWFTTVDPAGPDWITTIDPGGPALDPETDYTTVFFGSAWVPGMGSTDLGLASNIGVANISKADNAIVFTQNFDYYTPNNLGLSETDKLNRMSRALANTGAHELGHTLGLNHQPTTWNVWDYLLTPDDPNNNSATGDDSNSGYGLMAYMTTEHDLTYLAELGTDDLESSEFPIGQIDTTNLLLSWLT